MIGADTGLAQVRLERSSGPVQAYPDRARGKPGDLRDLIRA